MLFRLYKNVISHLKSLKEDMKINIFMISGAKPWKYGYLAYKERTIKEALNNEEILDSFLFSRKLSQKYGFRIDERVVEYPWFFSRIKNTEALLLDAGSTLNHKYLLDQPILKNRHIVIYSLSPEHTFRIPRVSYIYGDLRRTILKDEVFDEIICLSTLEHIGMDSTFLYTSDFRLKEANYNDYKAVVKEFKRILKPKGKLFITVPYGRYENLGWQQQFDQSRVNEVIESFQPSSSDISYFKYSKNGWQIADAAECSDCSYYDIHKTKSYAKDYAAAARAVACIELVK